MSYVMVDVEANGPVPGLYSMIEIGAVLVKEPLTTTFYGQLKPITPIYNAEALNITGYTREDTLKFEDPSKVISRFNMWLHTNVPKPYMFISDNNSFDWQFINYYFHNYLNNNPFGYSSTNLGSFFKGIKRDTKANFKKMRKTRHDHNPLNDAIGNAEAMLEIIKKYNVKIKL